MPSAPTPALECAEGQAARSSSSRVDCAAAFLEMNMKVSIDKNILAVLLKLAEGSLETIKQDGLDVPPDLIVAITEIRRLLRVKSNESVNIKGELPKYNILELVEAINREQEIER
jgi:hypothetical protein